MGILSTYSKSNRVVMSDTVTSFSRTKIYGNWTWTNDLNIQFWITSAWEYRRIKQKSYKYVGMTYEAATRCAAAAVAYYTRSTYVSEFQTTGANRGTFQTVSGGVACLAEIVITNTAGHLWEVDINVSEEDARVSTYAVDPSSMFSTENARKYDDGDVPFVDEDEEEE